MKKTNAKIERIKKEKVERRNLAQEDSDLMTAGKSFLLKQMGIKGHGFKFLGKASRLIQELDVDEIVPFIDENHVNVHLKQEIARTSFDKLLDKYQISRDYDGTGAEVRLHNGGDFYVYVMPVRYDK